MSTSWIPATNLFEGVIVGLLLAIVKTAWDVSEIHLDVEDDSEGGPIHIGITGNATFLRSPKVLDTLEASAPPDSCSSVTLRPLA